MGVLSKRPKGTKDVLPAESYKWKAIESRMSGVAELFGFREIRFPTFEHTEVFTRSVGDTTDVVQKEMYTFKDKGDRSITLKPEGTAGTVRAMLENGLLNEALPQKVYYITPAFRYEKAQAGRLREFHQFGCEMFGSADPAADAELICLAQSVLGLLNLDDVRLEINSIGCPECRKSYQEALLAYFNAHLDALCETCHDRLRKNPMRILDCKNPECAEIAKSAPQITHYLCADCQAHFERVQRYLQEMDIAYTVNPTIVRGLDYYTRTVFEFIADDIGAQSTVCGGGRYDGLVELMGGKPMPALGFAMGLERLLIAIESRGWKIDPPTPCQLYLASVGEAAAAKAVVLTADLRRSGIYAECDTMGRGLKAQMKYADKIGAKTTAVIGDEELASGQLKIKDMKTGDITSSTFDTLCDDIWECLSQKEPRNPREIREEMTNDLGEELVQRFMSHMLGGKISGTRNMPEIDGFDDLKDLDKE
ncbi:MAG TPA: histidine--tRNA ligase [Firmicutes bacterium]|nr:histidine--tRNA ligase [Bacillota bacterium]